MPPNTAYEIDGDWRRSFDSERAALKASATYYVKTGRPTACKQADGSIRVTTTITIDLARQWLQSAIAAGAILPGIITAKELAHRVSDSIDYR